MRHMHTAQGLGVRDAVCEPLMSVCSGSATPSCLWGSACRSPWPPEAEGTYLGVGEGVGYGGGCGGNSAGSGLAHMCHLACHPREGAERQTEIDPERDRARETEGLRACSPAAWVALPGARGLWRSFLLAFQRRLTRSLRWLQRAPGSLPAVTLEDLDPF